jgi:ABC-type branched-subunit amino acid transport system ATPase component
VLELQGLTRRYGELVALDHLSFSVAEGQMFGFVGPNGAGKTTAMRIVLGVLAPDAGEVPLARTTHDGRDAQTRRIYARGLRVNVSLTVRLLGGARSWSRPEPGQAGRAPALFVALLLGGTAPLPALNTVSGSAA